MANNKAFKVKNGLELGAISDTITDTAVDVFVYDTRKDSDGGAWRKRTQHTSWYNETLNTATRGSRKEFPAVAVIVAESNQVTIYDGDDPDLPMWMVFNNNSNCMIGNTGTISSVIMLNAELCVGRTSSSKGLGQISFLTEVGKTIRRASSGHLYIYKGNIEQRNDNLEYTNQNDSTQAITGDFVYDIAMTVLPNAPIDAATGLPVPTIAVATDGGTSVIRDDGTVVDITGTLGGSETKDDWVYFDKDGSLFMDDRGASSGLGGHYFVGFTEIPSADTTVTNADIKIGSDASSLNLNNLYLKGLLKNAVDGAVGSADATNAGLNFLDVNKTSVANSMIAYTTSDYATGWMNGNIKLATLSDTDDTNVTGSELVTNGTFDSDISGWTDPDSIASHDTNRISLTSASSNQRVYQAISTVVGQHYAFDFGTVTGNAAYYISNNTNSAQQLANSKTGSFTATQTTTYVVLYVIGTGNTSTFDNVSVRLAEEDRSVNDNGLQVFGTVTKSAVSTGADLVAYSGFSTSNYLEQPYNSDLDFGTGDFCVMGWFKTSSLSSDEVIFNRSDDGLTGVLLEIRTDSAGGKIRVFTGSSGYNGLVNFYSSTITTNTWNLISLVRTGSSISIHINGQLGTSSTSTQDLTNASAKARVGIRYLSGAYSLPLTNGALALWRISATAPSAEQIKKIYEDEKFLFQENAQATLYGSSDAVTALAYDDTTELLHAGTSAGRSVFQGLRRVDNTTTAVSAAISASNNLVGEQ